MAKNRQINTAVDDSNSSEFRKLRAKDRRLIKLCYKKAYKVYGKDYDKPCWTRSFVKKAYDGKDNEFLPNDVLDDVNKGLHEIIDNGYAALYLDQAKLIEKHGWDKCKEVFCPKSASAVMEKLLLS